MLPEQWSTEHWWVASIGKTWSDCGTSGIWERGRAEDVINEALGKVDFGFVRNALFSERASCFLDCKPVVMPDMRQFAPLYMERFHMMRHGQLQQPA